VRILPILVVLFPLMFNSHPVFALPSPVGPGHPKGTRTPVGYQLLSVRPWIMDDSMSASISLPVTVNGKQVASASLFGKIRIEPVGGWQDGNFYVKEEFPSGAFKEHIKKVWCSKGLAPANARASFRSTIGKMNLSISDFEFEMPDTADMFYYLLVGINDKGERVNRTMELFAFCP